MPDDGADFAAALNQLVGAPTEFTTFGQVEGAFGGRWQTAADFLGITTAPKGTAEFRRRDAFRKSWQRYQKGERKPTAGFFSDMKRAAAGYTQDTRAAQQIQNRRGVTVDSYQGKVDLYGSDIRNRNITQPVQVPADVLARLGFFQDVRQGRMVEARKAFATAWFVSYTGSNLGGKEADIDGEGLQMRLL